MAEAKQKLDTPEPVTGIAFDRFPDAIAYYTDDRHHIRANAAAEQLFEASEAELQCSRLDDFVPQSFVPELARRWSQFLAEGSFRSECQIQTRAGTVKDVFCTAVAHASPGVHVTVVRDITEEKQLQREYIASTSIANLALAAGRMGHWIWNSQTGDVSWNGTLEKLFGIKADEHTTYQTFLSIVHPEDLPFVRERIGASARYGHEYEIEYRIVRPDGEIRWIANRGEALRDPATGRAGLLGLCWDVTEARANEAAVRISEVRFRTLIEQSPLSTQVFSPDGTCILVNRAFCQFWGVSPHDVKQYNILRDDQLRDLGLMPLIQTAFAGTPAELPVHCYRPPTGRYVSDELWLRSFAYPVLDDEGRVREVVVLQENVTELKHLEIQRNRHAAELARSNAELQRFVYAASHDLKEPLRNIAAFSRLLEKQISERLTEDELEYLQHIRSGSTRMAELLESLLEYSRSTGQRDLVFETADLNHLLAQALDNLRLTISQSGASITVEQLPSVKCIPLNVVQLFQNLLGNAIKYSAPKPPIITVGADERDGTWVFRVTDYGIGIDPAFHDQIFGVFRRLHGREYAGTGIGLAICKSIVENHGGKIWVESELGSGSTFYFTLG